MISELLSNETLVAGPEFARRFFRPTKEEVEETQKHLDEISDNIKIVKSTDNGFEVEVKNLDLSDILDIEVN